MSDALKLSDFLHLYECALQLRAHRFQRPVYLGSAMWWVPQESFWRCYRRRPALPHGSRAWLRARSS